MFANPFDYFKTYSEQVSRALAGIREESYNAAYKTLYNAGRDRARIFVCGNGGSASIAEHFSCDHSKGVHMDTSLRPDVVSLASNMAVITAIGNDLGFDKIFSKQLQFANASCTDILVVVSSSGNSPNIILAIEQAKKMQVKSFAILGFLGGKCKALVDVPIHFPVDDMQISEDLQLIVGHMLMQWLYINRPQKN